MRRLIPHKKIALAGIILLLIAAGIYQWGWQDNPNKQILRYQPTGLNDHIDFTAFQSFSQYIKEISVRVRKARTLAQVTHTPLIISQNSPEELLPPATCKKTPQGQYQNGILLIHGLLASPYVMHELGRYFQAKCFLVYSILLPGHGTTPGATTEVNAENWLEAAQFGIGSLTSKVKNTYIGGYSGGGLLAILATLQHPPTKIKALILIAPALKLADKLSWAITPAYWLSRIMPRLEWIDKDDDINPVKYTSYPINLPYQTKRLIHQVQLSSLPQKMTLPLFLAQSADDATIDSETNFSFFESTHNPQSQMLWFAQSKLKNSTDPRIKVILSTLVKQKILGQSHVSLTLSESDVYFGRQGTIKECSHYPKNTPKWHDCEINKNTYLGEITPENLHQHTIRRITFNPFLHEIFQQLDVFLAQEYLAKPS